MKERKKRNEGRKEGGGRGEMILKNKTLYGFFTGSFYVLKLVANSCTNIINLLKNIE